MSTGVVAGAGDCPVSDFTADPVNGYAPLSVSFTDNSTGTISSRLWNFGDGQTSTIQNPTHEYTATGVYTVGLSVAGPGGSDWLVKPNYITVTVPPLPPVAAFSASPDQRSSSIDSELHEYIDRRVHIGVVEFRRWANQHAG